MNEFAYAVATHTFPRRHGRCTDARQTCEIPGNATAGWGRSAMKRFMCVLVLAAALALALALDGSRTNASSLNEHYFDGYLSESDQREYAEPVGYTYGGQIHERAYAFGPIVVAGFTDHTQTQTIAYARAHKVAQLYHPNQVGREFCRVLTGSNWRVTCTYYKYGPNDPRLGPSHDEFDYYYNQQPLPGGGASWYWIGETDHRWRPGPTVGYIYGGRICVHPGCGPDDGTRPLMIETRSPVSQGNHRMFYARTPIVGNSLGSDELRLWHPNVVGYSRCRHLAGAQAEFYTRCQYFRN